MSGNNSNVGAITGSATATGDGNAVGVLGTSATTSGAGVAGEVTGANAAGVYGTNYTSGYGVLGWANGTSGQGVWGESYGTLASNGVGPDGVHGVATSSAGSGVAGVNTAAHGVGVYGSGGVGVYGSGSDWAYQSAGNAQQARTAGGWVKAMVQWDGESTGTMTRCFNSTLGGAAATTLPCGFTVTFDNNSGLTIDFGFEVDDRFYSATLARCACGQNIPVLFALPNSTNAMTVGVYQSGTDNQIASDWNLIVF